MKTNTLEDVLPAAATDYKNMIDLMAVHAEASARYTAMESEMHSEFLELADQRRKEYAELQTAISQAETAIELIARANPAWFEVRKSVKTPYGTVSFRKSTALDVTNEEVSIVLIEKLCNEEEQASLLRTETKLNLEALEKLTDAQLKQFRINRVAEDNFSVKPAKIDLGKAVKEAIAKEAA